MNELCDLLELCNNPNNALMAEKLILTLHLNKDIEAECYFKWRLVLGLITAVSLCWIRWVEVVVVTF
mgnify:CR=1 FL=1